MACLWALLALSSLTTPKHLGVTAMPSPSFIPTHRISAAVLQSEMGALGGAGWAETWWEGELEHFPLYSGFFFVPSLINSSPLPYNPAACFSSHEDGSLAYVPSCDFVISLSSRIVQSLFCTHLGLYLQTQLELYEANCPRHISSAWRKQPPVHGSEFQVSLSLCLWPQYKYSINTEGTQSWLQSLCAMVLMNDKQQ